jgi:hypothetical protein
VHFLWKDTSGKMFFSSVLPNSVRLHEPSSFASLDRQRCGRTIHAALHLPNTRSRLDREHSCPSLRRIHRRTSLPDRGRRCRERELARAHRPDSRGPDRADALLWTDPRRRRQPASPVADSRPRTRLERGSSSVAAGSLERAPPFSLAVLACGLRPLPSLPASALPAVLERTPQTQSQPRMSRNAHPASQRTDGIWRAASSGFMLLEQINYRSSLGGLEIPAFCVSALESTRHAQAAVCVADGVQWP